MAYSLLFTPAFDRAYKLLPAAMQRKADNRILQLSENPHHPSLRTHKRRGERDVWQARITRSYRLYFRMEGQILTLLWVGPHEK